MKDRSGSNQMIRTQALGRTHFLGPGREQQVDHHRRLEKLLFFEAFRTKGFVLATPTDLAQPGSKAYRNPTDRGKPGVPLSPTGIGF
jgi:hypothetical protein